MSKSKIIRLFPIIMICLIISSSCSSELQVRESSDMPETGSGPGVEETVSTETNSVPEAPTENGSVPANSDDEELPRPSSTEEVDPPPPPPAPAPAIPPGNNVIVAAQGVLGWTIDGEWIEVDGPPIDSSSIPAEEGDLYRVLRTGSPTSIGVSGSAPTEGCPPLPGYTADIDIDDPMFNADGWPYTYPIAISSNWDLTPHDVESLSLESEIYKGFATEVLADLEIIDPDPNLITLIRTDLEGDGIDEVIIGAERISGSLISPSPGDYSILFMRKIVGGDVTQQLIAGDVYVGEMSYGMLSSYRLIAVADLNGDNRMEVTAQYGYYEGSSTHVLEYKNDIEGLQEVLVVGCGA